MGFLPLLAGRFLCRLLGLLLGDARLLGGVCLVAVEGVAADAAGDKRDGDDRMYDMMGRRVYGKPAPGLYIINGRKIIVK